MKKYIVKLFEISPFDKSDYIKNVQVLCDIETGEPYAHLDSPYNWVGQILDESDINVQWSSKKSKHLVERDKVLFGVLKEFCGTIDKIVEIDKDDYWKDDLYLINCYNTMEGLEAINIEFEKISETTIVKREKVESKSWLYAKIINDSVHWRVLEEEWTKFYFKGTENPNVTEILIWWKERVQPKESNEY